MRQAFRRYAFPMMIIAAVLAAALPLKSFALNISTINMTDDFAYNTLASNSWDYLINLSNNYKFTTSFLPDRTLYYPNINISSNVFSRFVSLYFTSPSTSYSYEYRIPLFLYDIYSLDFSFYFGVNATDGTLSDYDIVDIVLHTNSSSIDVPFDVSNGYSISYSSSVDLSVDSYNISYSSSSSFDALYLSIIYNFSIPSTASSSNRFYLYHTFALGVNSSFSTLSSNVDAIMQSHSVLAHLLDTVISQQNSSNVQIIDYLDQILAAVEANGSGSGGSGSDPGTGEGESILQEGAIKQEQLEQLGDAFSNVPKPSIENITQTFDPADTLISADPGMIQNALSIVYSWDKFLILLGLFIAVGTISYIIFGKKS